MTARAGLKAVRDALDNPIEPPIDGGDRDGRDDGGSRPTMPAGCPVIPLGTENGTFYFLSALGELRALRARDLGNKDIAGMFAPERSWLYEAFPAKKLVALTDDQGEKVTDANGDVVKDWIVTGWKTAEVSELLMDCAAALGVWNAHERVRGRGAWAGDHGELILHCGNHILFGGAWRRPGMHDGFVYPTQPSVPRPALGEPAGNGEALQLLSYLKTWTWARPTIDPYLLLGWIAIAPFGGAVDWRPVAWITGDKAQGKSTLQKLIALLFDGGLLATSDATEAAVRQLLGQQSLPVAIDEAEAEDDNRKLLALVKLARQAASGGRIFRGGQDHQGHEFVARSCFLFSSILVPPMQGADRSRLALLELGDFPHGAAEPKFVPAEIKALGAALRRRVADGWGRWPGLLAAYRGALIEIGGHGGRTADQFGTLLAAAHLLTDDEDPDGDTLGLWGERLAADTLAERSDDMSDAERCIQHLGSSLVQLSGHGTPRLVSMWIQQAATARDAGDRMSADEQLAKIGIRVVVAKGKWRAADAIDEARPRPVPGRTYIAVANSHQGLARLFAEGHWAGKSGASGVWSQSLKRVTGAIAGEVQRIGGQNFKCTMVPVEAMIAPDPDAPALAMADAEEDA